MILRLTAKRSKTSFSPDNHAALKRPLPKSKTEKISVYDTNSRSDSWDEPIIYDVNTLSIKIHVPNPQNHPEAAPKSSISVSHPEKVRTNTHSTRHCNVYTKKTEAIICTGDKRLWSQNLQERIVYTYSSPPPQTADATEAPDSIADTAECSPHLPQFLDVIKEFIQHDKDDPYISLILCFDYNRPQKKERMLPLPVE